MTTQIPEALELSSRALLCIALLEIPHVDADAGFECSSLFLMMCMCGILLCSHERAFPFDHCTSVLAFSRGGVCSHPRNCPFPFCPFEGELWGLEGLGKKGVFWECDE